MLAGVGTEEVETLVESLEARVELEASEGEGSGCRWADPSIVGGGGGGGSMITSTEGQARLEGGLATPTIALPLQVACAASANLLDPAISTKK